MSQFKFGTVVLSISRWYLFEHEEGLLAAIEVLWRFVSDQIAWIGTIQAFDDCPDVSDCIFLVFTGLEFIFGDSLCVLDSFVEIQSDDL